MKITLNNDTDLHDANQVAGLQNSRSVTATIAGYINVVTQGQSIHKDCEVTVHKVLLSNSYRGNPSLFGTKVLAALKGEWLDSSGWQTVGKRTHITIKLLRQAKPEHARRAFASPSIKQLIKQWLELNLPNSRKLTIPIAGIPAFYTTHPEQLTYAIKREMGTPIRIKRAKTIWIFARK